MTRCELRAPRFRARSALSVAVVPFGVALCGALAVACSSSSPPGNQGSASGEDGGGGGSGSSGGGSPTSADGGVEPIQISITSSFDVAKSYAGEYAAQITFGKIESAGTLGMMNATVTILGAATIAADASGQSTTFSLRLCHSTLTGAGTGLLQGASLTTPDVVLRTTTMNTQPFVAAKDGGTVEWQVPELAGPIGWTWSGPNDTLPTSQSDPRVVDQDMDHSPGVTIEVNDVALGSMPIPVYVVQLERDSFSGTVDGQGNLRGTVVDRTEQNVIGSSNILLASATLVQEPSSDTSGNVARFVRTPSSLSCDDVLAQASTLFP